MESPEQLDKFHEAVVQALVVQAVEEFATEANTFGVMRDIALNGFAMVTAKGLRNLRDLALQCQELPGAFVECGVARGGCLALLALLAGPDRTVWGFDSFEGLPDLTPEDEGHGVEWVGFQAAGPEGEKAVIHTFEKLGIPMDDVRVIAGWFQDTLPRFVDEVGAIALLRLDADFYKSTRFVLDILYDSVVPGGAIIIDDYFTFPGCRTAVDEFRAERRITSRLEVADPNSVAFWLK
jgi:O-methyltransferase